MARKKYIKNEKGIVRALATTNLGLEKPITSDFYDINIINRNMDKIDTAVEEVKGKVDNLELTANNVTVTDSGNYFSSENVEGALSELAFGVATNNSKILEVQNELGVNKNTLQKNISKIREVL